MSTPLKTLAIQHALSNNWKEAKNVNEQLVQDNPKDIDSLNRLGFAFMKLAKYNKAKEAYKKVINLDKTNPIALKNLKRLEMVSSGDKKDVDADGKNTPPTIKLNEVYIEEAGRTKTVELKNVADKKTLSLVEPGDPVSIAIKRSKIFIQTMDGKFIGMLPDNISMRLIVFMRGGNEYEACIKASDEKSVIVFMRETKKSTKFKNQASFTSSFLAQSSDSE